MQNTSAPSFLPRGWIMALYQEDGKCDHYGFFWLLCFRWLASWLDLWPKCWKDWFPQDSLLLLSFLSVLLHIPVPFVKTYLQGRLCELMPLSFRLDPAQVLSDWLLTVGRQKTKGCLPTPRLEFVFPPSGILGLASLYKWILDFSLDFPIPWWCWVLSKVQATGLWSCHSARIWPAPDLGQRPLAMSHNHDMTAI